MLELIINNISADLGESVALNLNKTFENLQNPTDYYSEYSKTINLPVTATNNAIFKHFYKADSLVTDDTIDPRKKQPFRLLWNGELIMSGYAKLENCNTVLNDEAYEVSLYSTFGMVMNELSQCTFNPYEDVDEKYIIATPFNEENLTIDRHLVKRSFEQETHDLDGEDVLDYIGFIPSYQGQYSDFESGKIRIADSTEDTAVTELSKERDEHYMREFRSYYQQPFIWVDKMWKMLQNKCAELTDYSIVLHPSWFNAQNPYWNDLIYTCPSLYQGDDNYVEHSCNLGWKSYLSTKTISNVNKLTEHARTKVYPKFLSGESVVYDETTGIFNPTKEVGFSSVTASLYLEIGCLDDTVTSNLHNYYCRIKKANPIYIKVRAADATTNEPIDGAEYTYMLYSSSVLGFTNYDTKIDVGITNRQNPNIPSDRYCSTLDGWWWGTYQDLTIKVLANKPYYLTTEVYTNVNDTPFEKAISSLVPHWDFLWSDVWEGGLKGSTIMRYGSCTSIEYLRSFSNISMYRIFPKDTTLLSTILNYCKMFGLLWDIDNENKTITVKTRNAYFGNKVIEDWTDKVDKSKDFVMTPINFDTKYVYFNVEDGDCSRLTQYQEKYKYGYGAKKIDTGYDFNSDSNDLFENIIPSIVSQKAQDSYYLNTEYPDSPNFKGYNYKVYPNEVFIDNDNEGSSADISGAFYFRHGTFVPDSRITGEDNNGNVAIRITDDSKRMLLSDEYEWNLIPADTLLCFKFPNVSTIYNGFSVHFEAPKEYYFKVNTNGVKYAYNAFWKGFINERYNQQNKKLECYLYITPNEYKTFTFYKFVMIDNVLYHINKIVDYDFDVNTPTKCELIQVWDLNAYTSGQHQFHYLFTNSNITTTTTDTEYTVESSSEWSIDSASFWIRAMKRNGKLILRAYNASARGRNGLVTLSNTEGDTFTIAVSQSPSTAIICDERSIVFEKNGGTRDISVYQAYDVTITNTASWLTVEDVAQNGMWHTYRFTATRNRLVNTKTATVTLTTEKGYITIAVSQLANDYIDIIDIDDIPTVTSGTATTIDFGVDRETAIGGLTVSNGTATTETEIGRGSITLTATKGGIIEITAKDGSVRVVPFNVKSE